MSRPRRWPLHPQPGTSESLSSWLQRLARHFDLTAPELLAGGLDLDVAIPEDVDHDPPEAMLVALAERTGAELAQLRAMTLAGWQPWLFDKLWTPQHLAQTTFDTYVRANSVLLAPGDAAPTSSTGSNGGPAHGYHSSGSTGCARCASPIPTEAKR